MDSGALDAVCAGAYRFAGHDPIDHLVDHGYLVVALARAGGGFGRIIPRISDHPDPPPAPEGGFFVLGAHLPAR